MNSFLSAILPNFHFRFDKFWSEGTYTVLKVGDQVLKRNKSKGKEIVKKYRPYYYQEIYVVVEDLKNGSYWIQELKQEKNSEIQNIQNLKKLHVQYKITLHPESNEISIVNSEPAPEEIVEDDDGYDFEVKEILKHKYLNGELYY